MSIKSAVPTYFRNCEKYIAELRRVIKLIMTVAITKLSVFIVNQ